MSINAIRNIPFDDLHSLADTETGEVVDVIGIPVDE
jgi:hypothetical protein